jgi:hypothetical protein
MAFYEEPSLHNAHRLLGLPLDNLPEESVPLKATKVQECLRFEVLGVIDMISREASRDTRPQFRRCTAPFLQCEWDANAKVWMRPTSNARFPEIMYSCGGKPTAIKWKASMALLRKQFKKWLKRTDDYIDETHTVEAYCMVRIGWRRDYDARVLVDGSNNSIPAMMFPGRGIDGWMSAPYPFDPREESFDGSYWESSEEEGEEGCDGDGEASESITNSEKAEHQKYYNDFKARKLIETARYKELVAEWNVEGRRVTDAWAIVVDDMFVDTCRWEWWCVVETADALVDLVNRVRDQAFVDAYAARGGPGIEAYLGPASLDGSATRARRVIARPVGDPVPPLDPRRVRS